jgi:hypothetical protein
MESYKALLSQVYNFSKYLYFEYYLENTKDQKPAFVEQEMLQVFAHLFFAEELNIF